MTRTFRYVTHENVLDYLRCGWHIATTDLGHHSFYSVLMVWLCSCRTPPLPRSEQRPE